MDQGGPVYIRRRMPPSIKLTIMAVVVLLLGMMGLVGVALWVTSHQPPASAFEYRSAIEVPVDGLS
jgi:hypothetical protein